MTNQTDQLPLRGNRFSQAIAAFFFKLTGWKVAGVLPNLPKLIVIGAPHTSNWDFPLAMNLIFYLGVRLNWMAKKEFFVKPFSYLWDWLGGISVDRHAASWYGRTNGDGHSAAGKNCAGHCPGRHS